MQIKLGSGVVQRSQIDSELEIRQIWFGEENVLIFLKGHIIFLSKYLVRVDKIRMRYIQIVKSWVIAKAPLASWR